MAPRKNVRIVNMKLADAVEVPVYSLGGSVICRVRRRSSILEVRAAAAECLDTVDCDLVCGGRVLPAYTSSGDLVRVVDCVDPNLSLQAVACQSTVTLCVMWRNRWISFVQDSVYSGPSSDSLKEILTKAFCDLDAESAGLGIPAGPEGVPLQMLHKIRREYGGTVFVCEEDGLTYMDHGYDQPLELLSGRGAKEVFVVFDVSGGECTLVFSDVDAMNAFAAQRKMSTNLWHRDTAAAWNDGEAFVRSWAEYYTR